MEQNESDPLPNRTGTAVSYHVLYDWKFE